MKRGAPITPAQKIIRRISELRDLARRLSQAGYRAGLHSHDPDQLPTANRVAEQSGDYNVRRQTPKKARRPSV